MGTLLLSILSDFRPSCLFLSVLENWMQLPSYHPASILALLQSIFQKHHLTIIPLLSYSPPIPLPVMECSQHCLPWHSRPFIFDPSLLFWLMSYLSCMLTLLPLPCSSLQSSYKDILPPLFLCLHYLKLLSSFSSGKSRCHLLQEIFPYSPKKNDALSSLGSPGTFHMPLLQHLHWLLLHLLVFCFLG